MKYAKNHEVNSFCVFFFVAQLNHDVKSNLLSIEPFALKTTTATIAKTTTTENRKDNNNKANINKLSFEFNAIYFVPHRLRCGTRTKHMDMFSTRLIWMITHCMIALCN